MRVGQWQAIATAIVTVVASGALLATGLQSSAITPRTVSVSSDLVINPTEMMVKAPRDLPTEQFEAH